MNDRLSYEESCFIVNAMEYYLADFKSNCILSEESQKAYRNIIDKYNKLEDQILNLRIND